MNDIDKEIAEYEKKRILLYDLAALRALCGALFDFIEYGSPNILWDKSILRTYTLKALDEIRLDQFLPKM